MVIRASSRTKIDSLINDLGSANGITREAAVARLTVLGGRAVDRLIGLAGDKAADQVARAAAFRALEAIGDPRAVDASLSAIGSGNAEVAAAAIAVVRPLIDTARGAEIVDALTGAALNAALGESVRLAAIRALAALAPATVKPVADVLAGDRSARIQAAAAALGRPAAAGRTLRVPDLLAERLADDPALVRAALAHDADVTPLPALLQLIERIREREAEAGPQGPDWTMARASVHAVLAGRGSRLALFDLRETLERDGAPMPVEMVAALGAVGDATVLESIAAAYARSTSAGTPPTDWWPSRLADAFRAIVRRGKITRRHAALARIRKRHPQALAALWPKQAREGQ